MILLDDHAALRRADITKLARLFVRYVGVLKGIYFYIYLTYRRHKRVYGSFRAKGNACAHRFHNNLPLYGPTIQKRADVSNMYGGFTLTSCVSTLKAVCDAKCTGTLEWLDAANSNC